ncbi:MAG: PstS family phosphate ABC transporter substrate-binding protein [Actinobacteria bacterium]|nr:PstS family phosphate ABC transporter substrate-binding protein [Actinomycetota bacterium]
MNRNLARMPRFILLALGVSLAITAIAAAGTAGTQALRGTIQADGSSTVGPYVQAAAQGFEKKNKSVRIVVGISGTGGGFERFCRGETDLSNASRPIKQTESTKCRDKDVRYVAFHVANDGLSVVVNKSNTWASCLTTEELKSIWDTGSKVDNWNDVRSGFPNVPLRLFGPGTDSGTFDFFTEKINGKSRRSRSDYQATENDNVIVRGVSGERGGMGYFGLSYYVENKNRLKVVGVNNGSGCVKPSIQTVQNGKYKPLGRPLFVYAKRDSFRRAEVRGFVGYMLNNQKSIATKSDFVPLTKKQVARAKEFYKNALKG